jgi:predicted molibdopterin-dependent oxidoreductase YjgC
MKRLKIDDRKDICSTCGVSCGKFKIFASLDDDDPLKSEESNDLAKVIIITTCTKCRILLRKIEEFQKQLRLRTKSP